jgi:para-aminobenzoate synthetase component 1
MARNFTGVPVPNCIDPPRIETLPQLHGTPRQVFARLRPHAPALLESAMPPATGAGPRWSYIAGAPAAQLVVRDGAAVLRADGRELARWPDAFAALDALLQRAACPRGSRPAGLDFAAGLIGFLGYDMAHGRKRPHAQAGDLPDMALWLADHVLAYEHHEQRWYSCTTLGFLDAQARQRAWHDTLARAQGADAAVRGFRAGVLAATVSAEEYRRRIRRCLDYIREGHIYQANLSHRLETAFSGDPFTLYCAVTAANPAPFAAYLEDGVEDGAWAIASASPERFLELRGGRVTARPIKGTRPRGADAAGDLRQRDALAASAKDRAENVMIADLLRNDLGRVAAIGSVRAEELFGIEAHPSVWQMVSTVSAELRAGLGPADLLRACWPPGSMTGAPKRRAMQIIEELEGRARGPYAGAIGYFDASGDMDLSVVIRTVVVAKGRAGLQVGSGIVADSDPEDELQESYAKGRLLMQAVAQAADPKCAS